MRLSELHAAIDVGEGPAFSGDERFSTLVAIEHLAQIEGLPVSALGFAPPEFGRRYGFPFKHLRGSWSGQAHYVTWRNLILNAQMLFTPGDVDGDPWLSLCRAERIWKKKRAATLYDLRNFLPAELLPRDVTGTILMEAYGKVPEEMTGRFRAGVNNFRQLFCQDLALQSGLLPDTCPRPLPKLRDHHILTNMSPEIEGWRNSLSDRSTRNPLDYLHRLAVAGGLLNGKTDTLDDLRAALCELPSPAEVGIPPIKAKTLRAYENLVRHALGGRDPRKGPAEQAWADFRNAARAAACETSFLWALGNPAAAHGLFPQDLSENAALQLLWTHDSPGMRAHFQRGCEQFDATRGKISLDMLPPLPLGVRRTPPKPRRIYGLAPRPSQAQTAWAKLYARLRLHGWTHNQLAVLSYVRVQASAVGMGPQDLSQPFIESLDRKITGVPDRKRLRAAVAAMAMLSGEGNFSDLPRLSMPDDNRRTHGGLGIRARAELEELMEFMNAAATTRRSFRVAVGVLRDAMGRPDSLLKEILQADISTYDLGPHEPRRKVHTDKIRSLRDFCELPWTSAWRKLQRMVVGTGITALDNPVPKVLSWNPGTDPDGLTLEWAKRLDRELRSTLKNPPHGRADLAKTLARHLDAFDTLHNIPEIAGSGMLPPRIGRIR